VQQWSPPGRDQRASAAGEVGQSSHRCKRLFLRLGEDRQLGYGCLCDTSSALDLGLACTGKTLESVWVTVLGTRCRVGARRGGRASSVERCDETLAQRPLRTTALLFVRRASRALSCTLHSATTRHARSFTWSHSRRLPDAAPRIGAVRDSAHTQPRRRASASVRLAPRNRARVAARRPA